MTKFPHSPEHLTTTVIDAGGRKVTVPITALPESAAPVSGAEFPKMATTKLGDRIVPLLYPATHPEKGGQHVIFHNKDEEAAYAKNKIGVAGPVVEQTPQHQPSYLHGAWHIEGVAESKGNK